MGKKKIIGLVALILGIVLIVFSMYVKMRLGETQQTLNEIKSPFSNNPVGSKVGESMQEAANMKMGEYATFATWALYGGIILVVIGGGVMFCCKKKR